MCVPPRSKILSIWCSFWGNLAKSYYGAPSPRVSAPTSEKLWTHHIIIFSQYYKVDIFLYFQHSGRSTRCVFREIITPGKYTEFQSVKNPMWYIGFRKNGKPLKGFQYRSEQKRQCYQFIKTDFPYADNTDNQQDIGGRKVNFRGLVDQLWTQEYDKTWPLRHGSSLS